MIKGLLIQKILRGAILIGALYLLDACEHEQGAGPQSGLQPTLSSIQANIFTPKCVNEGCHPGQGAPMSLERGVAFGALVGVPSAFGLSRVQPFSSENSVLYLKVIGDPSTSARMPLGRPALTDDEIQAIGKWIDAGAQNN